MPKTKTSPVVGSLRVLSQDKNLNYEVELAVLRSGVNRNQWDFRNVEQYANTFLGTPILCAYVGSQIGDGHNMKEVKGPDGKPRYSFTDPTAERIVGTIYDTPNAVWTEQQDGETWIKARGKLWRFYHPELVDKIAAQGKMEVSAETDVSNSRRVGDVEVFEAWKGLGVTILGDRVDPAVPGANIRAMAAMQQQFQEMKLRAASLQPKQEKGVKPLSVKSKKTLMKEMAEKLPDYRILDVSGNHVLMLNSERVPCSYEVREEDHGTVIPERITPVTMSAVVAFNETEKVELDCGELLSAVTQESAEKAESSAKECETVKSELADCKAQLAAMTEKENARRMKACEEAVKAQMEAAVKNLSVDSTLADSVLADVTAGKYMNSMDAEGNWTGDQMAVNALLAKIGEAQMKAAAEKKPTRYAWEGGFAPNSAQGDSLEAVISRISE